MFLKSIRKFQAHEQPTLSVFKMLSHVVSFILDRSKRTLVHASFSMPALRQNPIPTPIMRVSCDHEQTFFLPAQRNIANSSLGRRGINSNPIAVCSDVWALKVPLVKEYVQLNERIYFYP